MVALLVMKRVGRRKPYTAIGIRRLKCVRCGQRAEHQWDCCANGNRKVPVCLDCDVRLNAVVLAFMRIPGHARLMRVYRRKVYGP